MPRVTPRCPHCASPKLDGGVCRACGRRVDEAPDLPRLEGIEPTHIDTNLVPRRAAAAAAPNEKRICAKCSVPNPPTRELCLACGERL